MKVAILDLDGTLVDTLDDLAAAVNAALEAVGLPPRRRDEVRRFVGEGARVLVS
ncbi:MAG TPA: HAD hydrolase-like protein, partial [Anaeromyxobacteraceae bacterium]|nr:HAD hydrolase-like protein [Anaeromyxobacteraceae bacterium]